MQLPYLTWRCYPEDQVNLNLLHANILTFWSQLNRALLWFLKLFFPDRGNVSGTIIYQCYWNIENTGKIMKNHCIET